MTLTRTLVVVASTRPHETDPPAPTVMITTTMTTTPTSLALDTMANVNRTDFAIIITFGF